MMEQDSEKQVSGNSFPQVKVQYEPEMFQQPFLANFVFPCFQFQLSVKMQENALMGEEEKRRQIIFLNFFSPKQTAASIQRKNENLEMIKFQNSREEPDDVFNRRKMKVSILLEKEDQLLAKIRQIRRQNYSKYLSIINFVSFFCDLKQRLQGIKTDYYSNKTFCAIRNSSEEDLQKITKVTKKMFNNIMTLPKFYPPQSVGHDERIIEFLIIPRFLISKQKIIKLINDEQLQSNFEFLIYYECLGHYNNEANKKLPEERQMNLVKDLLRKNDGREKFKKICSINHGNKFLIKYPMDYYQLYYKNLDYLKYLDTNFKKGKKYEAIKKNLEKHPLPTTEGTFGNSSKDIQSQSESGSSKKVFSFSNIERALDQAEGEDELERDELIDQMSLEEKRESKEEKGKSKLQVKRLCSMPLELESNGISQRSFKVKKQLSDTIKTENMIIVPPPPANK